MRVIEKRRQTSEDEVRAFAQVRCGGCGDEDEEGLAEAEAVGGGASIRQRAQHLRPSLSLVMPFCTAPA